MINKIIDTLTKPSRIILLVGSFVYAALFAITTIGGGVGDDFMPLLASLILMIAGTAVLVATPILLILNKDNLAKIVFLILAGYWLISSILNMIGTAYVITDESNGLIVTFGIFAFLTGLTLLGVFALIILSFVFKKDSYRFFALLAMGGVILFSFVAGIFFLIAWGNAGAISWVNVLDAINDYFLAPVLILFGYLHFVGAPKKEETSEVKVD